MGTRVIALTASPRRFELAMEKKISEKTPMPLCYRRKSLFFVSMLTPEPSGALAGAYENVLRDLWSRLGLAYPRTASQSTGAKAEDGFHLLPLPFPKHKLAVSHCPKSVA